mgnify:CR=1 FL=1
MVCQNESIEDSDADLARDLRRIVRERVAAGDDHAAVIRFVHDRYGDFVLLRPPFLFAGEAVHWAMLLPLGTAALFAVYQILTRRLATVDDPRTTILHTSLAAALVTSAVLPFDWTWPSAGGWTPLVLLGVLGGAGHGLLVMAFARAPASLLAPMSYTQMIWAVLAGLLVFGDMPDALTLTGMVVIAAGWVLVALPERRRASA